MSDLPVAKAGSGSGGVAVELANGSIDSFSGVYRFLSNFWLHPVEMDGVIYASTEHAYQAAKTVNPAQRKQFQKAKTPGQAKALGKDVQLRSGWEGIKVMIMKNLLREKFKDPELKAKLLATGDRDLIEGNHWKDTYWGVCEGKGLNMLGKLLMEVRKELSEQSV